MRPLSAIDGSRTVVLLQDCARIAVLLHCYCCRSILGAYSCAPPWRTALKLLRPLNCFCWSLYKLLSISLDYFCGGRGSIAPAGARSLVLKLLLNQFE